MEWIREGILIAKMHFLCWKKDSRVWFILLSCISSCKTLGGITKFGPQYQTNRHCFFFQCCLRIIRLQMVWQRLCLYFAFIVLLCNAPFKDERICYIIARSGKVKWWLGGILYSVVDMFLFSAIFNDRSGRYNSSSMYIKAILGNGC